MSELRHDQQHPRPPHHRPRDSCAGALAAEPTYLLVDTAIVGHLGTTQLAALALAATFLGSAFWLFNFLAYGTTAQVSRLHGGGDASAAGAIGAQALWLALAIGCALVVVGEALAPQIVALLQGEGAVAEKAENVSANQLPRRAVRDGRARRRGLPSRGAADDHAAEDPGRLESAERGAGVVVRLRARHGHRRICVGHGDRAGGGRGRLCIGAAARIGRAAQACLVARRARWCDWVGI